MTRPMADAWRMRLDHLRSGYLAMLALEPDGSGSPDVLARRAAVRQLLPAAVSYFRSGNGRAVCLELNGTFEFSRPTMSDAARSFIADTNDRVMSMTEPGGEVVWIAVGAAGPPPYLLGFALDHSIASRLEGELSRRQEVLAAAFETIGLRPVVIPTPDGTADPRIGAVARFPRDALRPRRLEPADLARDASSLGTLVVVPDHVESIVQRARLLYVRAWNQWEFFTLAKREAFFALEASLRLLDGEERGSRSHRPFSKLLDTVGRSAERPLLSDWERLQGHQLRLVRNEMTHPTRGRWWIGFRGRAAISRAYFD